jgi:hypothetical protein
MQNVQGEFALTAATKMSKACSHIGHRVSEHKVSPVQCEFALLITYHLPKTKSQLKNSEKCRSLQDELALTREPAREPKHKATVPAAAC